MPLWGWLLQACAAVYAIKLAGYLVPARWLENARMTRVAGTLTIGLLAALTAMNAFSAGQALALDARPVRWSRRGSRCGCGCRSFGWWWPAR